MSGYVFSSALVAACSLMCLSASDSVFAEPSITYRAHLAKIDDEALGVDEFFVDGWRAGMLESAFRQHQSLDNSAIDVQVMDRHISLSGFVTSEAARLLAEQIALSIDGVDHVMNDLVLLTAEQVEKKQNKRKSQYALGVSTVKRSQHIALPGRGVGASESSFLKESDFLENDALKNDVISNDLENSRWSESVKDAVARDTERLTSANDEVFSRIISSQVKSKLLHHSVTRNVDVQVQVEGDTVVLLGHVDTLPVSELIQYLAQNTDGVRRVVNKIVVNHRS